MNRDTTQNSIQNTSQSLSGEDSEDLNGLMLIRRYFPDLADNLYVVHDQDSRQMQNQSANFKPSNPLSSFPAVVSVVNGFAKLPVPYENGTKDGRGDIASNASKCNFISPSYRQAYDIEVPLIDSRDHITPLATTNDEHTTRVLRSRPVVHSGQIMQHRKLGATSENNNKSHHNRLRSKRANMEQLNVEQPPLFDLSNLDANKFNQEKHGESNHGLSPVVAAINNRISHHTADATAPGSLHSGRRQGYGTVLNQSDVPTIRTDVTYENVRSELNVNQFSHGGGHGAGNVLSPLSTSTYIPSQTMTSGRAMTPERHSQAAVKHDEMRCQGHPNIFFNQSKARFTDPDTTGTHNMCLLDQQGRNRGRSLDFSTGVMPGVNLIMLPPAELNVRHQASVKTALDVGAPSEALTQKPSNAGRKISRSMAIAKSPYLNTYVTDPRKYVPKPVDQKFSRRLSKKQSSESNPKLNDPASLTSQYKSNADPMVKPKPFKRADKMLQQRVSAITFDTWKDDGVTDYPTTDICMTTENPEESCLNNNSALFANKGVQQVIANDELMSNTFALEEYALTTWSGAEVKLVLDGTKTGSVFSSPHEIKHVLKMFRSVLLERQKQHQQQQQ